VNGKELWLSGLVRRWHSNPDLAYTGQTNAHHQWSCAVLALYLWPDDAELLRACLLHDAGEMHVGDVPSPAKAENPALKEMLDQIEGEQLRRMGVEIVPSDRLKFIDRLEAYLWAMHHQPKLRYADEWYEPLVWLADTAKEMGVLNKAIKLGVIL
jgi:hypothetical protein